MLRIGDWRMLIAEVQKLVPQVCCYPETGGGRPIGVDVKRNSRVMFVVIALLALILPLVAISAQAPIGQAPAAGGDQGRGGGAGRGGARGATANNPPPTSPVTGNAVNGKTLFYG